LSATRGAAKCARTIIKAEDILHSYRLNSAAVLKIEGDFFPAVSAASPPKNLACCRALARTRPTLLAKVLAMRQKKRALQLRLIPNDDLPRERLPRTARPHDDLIGRRFFDGLSSVVVTGTCRLNPAQVWVMREMDGKSWSISAGLIRHITTRERKRRTA
jgi:hypothetical protein